MGKVFANGREVACKAQANKVIADFPDVCFTPPENPATPPGVPVPYPSFGMDSDTENGTGSVKIGGQNITQKNKSYYSKTTGTEAGCAAKKNVVTSVNRGKEYAQAWSSNVKGESMPFSRFGDISTNDHASPPAGAPPMPKAGEPAAPPPPAVCPPCDYEAVEEKQDRDARIADCDKKIKDAQAAQAAHTQNIADHDAKRKLKPGDAKRGGKTNTQLQQLVRNEQAALKTAKDAQQKAENDRKGIVNEKKVSDDVGGSKCYKFICKKCKQVGQELDVVIPDGRVKEVKSSAGGVNKKAFAKKIDLVETKKLLPGATKVKLAFIGPVPPAVAADPDFAGRTQSH